MGKDRFTIGYIRVTLFLLDTSLSVIYPSCKKNVSWPKISKAITSMDDSIRTA